MDFPRMCPLVRAVSHDFRPLRHCGIARMA
jgi:hypothetical protein